MRYYYRLKHEIWPIAASENSSICSFYAVPREPHYWGGDRGRNSTHHFTVALSSTPPVSLVRLFFSRSNAHTTSMLRCSDLALAAVFALLVVLTTTAEVIIVEPRRLRESSSVSPVAQPGPWAFGETVTQDREFFRSEDAAHKEWLSWRATLLKMLEDTAKDTKEKEVSEKREGARVEFTESSTRARRITRNNMTWDVNRSLSEKMLYLQAEADRFYERIMLPERVFSPSQMKDETAPDYLFNALVQKCFRHTVFNYTDKSGAQPWLTLLSYPMILDPGALTYAEQELRGILRSAKYISPKRGTTTSSHNTSSSTEVNEGEEALAVEFNGRTGPTSALEARLVDPHDLLSRSRNGHRQLLALSRLLFPAAVLTASNTLQDVVTRMNANDEATEVQRLEMRVLLRHKARMQSWLTHLQDAQKKLHKAAQMAEMLGSGADHVITLSMMLLAHGRLGCTADLPILDMLPPASIFTQMTGLLKEDVTSLVGNPTRVFLAFICIVYLVRELKMAALRGFAATTSRTLAGHRTASNTIYRWLVRLCGLLESAGPLLVPPVLLYYAPPRERLAARTLFTLLSPPQRLGVALLVVAVAVVCKLVALVVCALPSFIGVPPRPKRSKKSD